MLTLVRKQEPLCKSFRGFTDQISYTTIDRQSGTTRKKVKLESRMIGGNYLAMGRMRLPSVGLGGIARCRSPPFFYQFL